MLFNFLKRKQPPAAVDINGKNGFELINDGVLFEDTKTFLRWGADIDESAKLAQHKKERRSDRVIYHWGEHIVLNGLTLDLSTVYWDHIAGNELKRFTHVEFLSLGDRYAEKKLNIISGYLEQLLGPPAKGKLLEPDISRSWRTRDVIFVLEYYERYAHKLHLEIRRLI